MLFAEKSRLQPYAQCVGHLRSQRAAIGTLHGSLSVLAWREHRQTYSGGYTLVNGTTRKPSEAVALSCMMVWHYNVLPMGTHELQVM